jgi:hypothetical protein
MRCLCSGESWGVAGASSTVTLARCADPDAPGTVFDPYGSAGSSAQKGYKLTLGASDTDLEIMQAREPADQQTSRLRQYLR